MFGSIGALILTWSFIKSDRPNYSIGNGLGLATSSTILIVGMKMDNQKRERRSVEGMSEKQVQNLGWRHPNFRWTP